MECFDESVKVTKEWWMMATERLRQRLGVSPKPLDDTIRTYACGCRLSVRHRVGSTKFERCDVHASPEGRKMSREQIEKQEGRRA